MPGLTLFDQSTLVQVERKLVSIQRAQRSAGCIRSLTCARARRWLAWCGHVAYRTQPGARHNFQGWRKAEVRQIRSKSSVLFDDLEASRSTVMMDNPMHTGGTSSTPDAPGVLRSDALPEPELQHQNNTMWGTAELPQFTRSMRDRDSSVASRPRVLTSNATL